MKIIKRERDRLIIEHENVRYKTTPEVYNQYKHGLYTIDDLIFHSLPVSVPWKDFIDLTSLQPEDFERELYRHGIHTLEDMVNNPTGARAAISKAYKISPGVLVKRVRQKLN